MLRFENERAYQNIIQEKKVILIIIKKTVLIIEVFENGRKVKFILS